VLFKCPAFQVHDDNNSDVETTRYSGLYTSKWENGEVELSQGRSQDLRMGGTDYGERVEREPITGVRGLCPLRLKSFAVFHIHTSD
jgi:hypothetical protein